MLSVMLFIFFCFFGVLGMLWYMLRQQNALFQQLRDELAQQRLLLRAMECRLEAQAPDAPAPPPVDDSLLQLSFDLPQPPPEADGLDLHFEPPQAASR